MIGPTPVSVMRRRIDEERVTGAPSRFKRFCEKFHKLEKPPYAGMILAS